MRLKREKSKTLQERSNIKDQKRYTRQIITKRKAVMIISEKVYNLRQKHLKG